MVVNECWRVQRGVSLAIAGGVTILQGSRSKRPASLGHGSGWNRSKRLGVVGVRIALKSPRWRVSERNLEGKESGVAKSDGIRLGMI